MPAPYGQTYFTPTFITKMRECEAQGLTCYEAYLKLSIEGRPMWSSFQTMASTNKLWRRPWAGLEAALARGAKFKPQGFTRSNSKSLGDTELLTLIPAELRYLYVREANARELTVDGLIRRILRHVGDDNLFKAVLEE